MSQPITNQALAARPGPDHIQTQCWICPHCFDDKHHVSDAHGCERHGRPEHDARLAIGPTDI